MVQRHAATWYFRTDPQPTQAAYCNEDTQTVIQPGDFYSVRDGVGNTFDGLCRKCARKLYQQYQQTARDYGLA